MEEERKQNNWAGQGNIRQIYQPNRPPNSLQANYALQQTHEQGSAESKVELKGGQLTITKQFRSIQEKNEANKKRVPAML